MPTYQDNAADTLKLGAAVGADEISVTATDGLSLGDVALGIDLPNLIENLRLTGSVLGFSTLRNGLTETVNFSDTMQVAYLLLLQENIQLAAIAAANPLLLGALVDTLHATGQAESRLDAIAALSAALAMESLISNGWSVSAIDSVEFNDAMTAAASFLGPLVDSASMVDSVQNAVRLLAVAADTVVGADQLSTVLQATEALTDGVLLYATVRLGGTEYAGWVLNTLTSAPSEYRNTPFDSLTRFRGMSLGAGDGGIFELAGNDDAGDPIAAFIRTGLQDFGTGKRKRIPRVYIGYRGNGGLVLKVVTTTDTGAKVEDWYTQRTDPRVGGDVREGSFEPGRGLKSRYWQFEIHNTAGDDLELTEIALRPLILDSRI